MVLRAYVACARTRGRARGGPACVQGVCGHPALHRRDRHDRLLPRGLCQVARAAGRRARWRAWPAWRHPQLPVTARDLK